MKHRVLYSRSTTICVDVCVCVRKYGVEEKENGLVSRLVLQDTRIWRTEMRNPRNGETCHACKHRLSASRAGPAGPSQTPHYSRRNDELTLEAKTRKPQTTGTYGAALGQLELEGNRGIKRLSQYMGRF